jgi:hypothetical protein
MIKLKGASSWYSNTVYNYAEVSKKAKILLAICVIIILISVGVERVFFITDSVPYSNAVKFIKSDPSIRNRFGAIYNLGIPSGDIDYLKGHSYFKIKIKGELQSEKIIIELKKVSYGTWTVVSWKTY